MDLPAPVGSGSPACPETRHGVKLGSGVSGMGLQERGAGTAHEDEPGQIPTMLRRQRCLALEYRMKEQERLDEADFTALFCNRTIYLDIPLIYRQSLSP